MSEKNKELIYSLKYWMVIFLYAYYSLILISGIAITIKIMLLTNLNDNLVLYTVLTSLSSCGMLCSVQYLRKLYKACIQDRIDSDNKQKNYIIMGNFLYFLLRPLFAFAFVIVMIFGLRSGLVIISGTECDVINERFFYISAITSGIIGFSIGNVIERFEYFSSNKVCQIISSNKEE